MRIINILRRVFGILPTWSCGLECQICQKTFINPEEHYKCVLKGNDMERHRNSILVLKSL